MRKHVDSQVVVVKPIWWRQTCFTLFLFVVALFFSFVGYFGPVISWAGTLCMLLISILSLLDQIYEWSRLRIDRAGFSLRGWFRNQFFSHEEIESFEIVEFTGKKLLAVHLKGNARKQRGLTDQPLAFPCCFGHPVEMVLKIVRAQIDRTPRARK